MAESRLLKDDTEGNEVGESGSEFHSVTVLAAKDFWNRVEAQQAILSFCLVVDPLTGLSHRTRSRWNVRQVKWCHSVSVAKYPSHALPLNS